MFYSSSVTTRTVTTVIGASFVGIAGYLVYLLLKSDNDDDDYSSTIPRISNHKTIEVHVPRDAVRNLIGRGGKNIKEIQEQSNTKIHFKDMDESSSERLCVVKGSNEGCNAAENLIREFIESLPVIECMQLQVEQQCVGRIIGRCGEQISEISSLSGAKMNFIDSDRSAPTRKLLIRGTREQINLAKAYIEEITEKWKAMQNKMESSLAKREPRAPPKNGESAKSIDSPRVETISPLPGQDSQFDVYVSAMVDPSHFWLQIVGPKATELDQLVEDMTDYYSKPENREFLVLESVQPGDLVAALFKYDNKWYRAEILKVGNGESQQTAEIYFVDYGDTDSVSCKEVYELRTDFLQLHFQAIECYLGRVEPTGENWSDEAVDKFEEWTHVAQWKKLSAKINGYTVREKMRAKREGSPVPGVDLFDVSNEQDLNIAEELVKHGYAVFKKENDVRSSSSRATSTSNISVESV